MLETERLLIREMTEADADDLVRLSANPNVTRFTGDRIPIDHDGALAILRTRMFPQYRDHRVGRLAVILKASGEFIGWCGLKYLAREDEYDLGYRLFEERWGLGFATEAARSVLEDGRKRFAGARIAATAMIDNHASIHVLEKIGMRFERFGEDDLGAIAIYVDR